jgi:AcrR family transcriptional regulator
VARVKKVSKRALQAQETRRRILTAAHELFIDDGYGATSLQEVADRAGVAVQTIYFVFGNKRTLLKELVDVTIAGDDEPVATMNRPWFQSALAAETAEAHLRAYVAGTRTILERIAPITKVMATAAAMDPEIATLWQYEEDPRYVVHATAAGSLMGKPGASENVSAERAADILFGLLSPELYLLFVRDRGWSPDRWEQWTYDILHAELCSPAETSARRGTRRL